MRRIAVLLGPLLVVLLPVAAYAMDHWGRAFTVYPTPDNPPGVLWGIADFILIIVILALFIRFFSLAEPGKTVPTGWCAFFVALGTVGTAIILLDYFLIGFQDAIKINEVLTNILLVGIYFLVVFAVWFVLAGNYCLNWPVRKNVFRVTIVPALIAAILVWTT